MTEHEDREPIRQLSPSEIDREIAEHIATTHIWDDDAGEMYEPTVVPPRDDGDGDD